MKLNKIFAIGVLMAVLSPISAYASSGLIVDSTWDPGTDINSFSTAGAAQVTAALTQAITDGHGSDSFYWTGAYDINALNGDWSHGCGYNGNYSSPNTPVINISSTCIPNGGALIPGHTTIYECITNLWNGATFYDVIAHGMTPPCVQYNWNGTEYHAVPALSDTTTHIVNITPPDKSTLATSTSATVGTNVYINSQQYQQAAAANNSNWFVQMTITPASVVTGIPSAAGSFDAAFGTTVITFPISSSGYQTLATTTSITNIGQYNISTQIIQPSAYNAILTWFGFGSARILAASSTSFIASNRTGFDTLSASTSDIITDFFASSSPALIASCASFTGFNLGDCLNLLFIPQSGDLSRVMNTLNTGLFSYAPFGYFTRMVTILSSQATSTFPMLSTSFPNPSNPSQMLTYTFDQNEALAGAGTVLDNLTIPQDPSVNARAAMDLIVKTVIALSVMSYIFYDLAHSTRGAAHGAKTKLS